MATALGNHVRFQNYQQRSTNFCLPWIADLNVGNIGIDLLGEFLGSEHLG